jgi:CRP-like cAMP-binding protein
MFLPISEIFKDLRQEAVNEISEIATEKEFGEGSRLFSADEPADHIYILVEGSVKLAIGTNSRKEYVVNKIGEGFGWSSVVGNECYTAEATCTSPTKLLQIEKNQLEKVFDAHERSGRKFYRSLARQLGERLTAMHS